MNLVSFIQPLTNDEDRMVVKVSDPLVTEFTEENKNTYEENRLMAAHPAIYGSKAPNFLNFQNIKLISIKDILTDFESNTQKARPQDNPKEAIITDKILMDGFELSKLGIFLAKHPTKKDKYIILEGKTRFLILFNNGMTNIIAEVFHTMSTENALRFGVWCNSSKDESGIAGYNDWLSAASQLAKKAFPNFDRDDDGDDGERGKMIEFLTEELNYLSDRKITNTQKDDIIRHIIDGWNGDPETRTYPSGKGSVQDMHKLIGAAQLAKDKANGIHYKAMTTNEFNYTKVCVRTMAELEEEAMGDPSFKINEVRLVVYQGKLNVPDPATDWKKSVFRFDRRVEEVNNKIGNILFNGSRPVYTKISLYGCIPQVYKLHDDFNMDRIHVYPSYIVRKQN